MLYNGRLRLFSLLFTIFLDIYYIFFTTFWWRHLAATDCIPRLTNQTEVLLQVSLYPYKTRIKGFSFLQLE